MLKLVLTSDFPSTVNQAVIDCMRDSAPSPRIAWIPPLTGIGRKRFPVARKMFESYGFPTLEYCDIDEESNERQLERLTQYDIIYLTGGDPIIFRRNILQAELSTRLRQCLTVGRLIIAASGGSMQFTKNVSLFRLLTVTLGEVIATHGDYEALGVVGYEILPHFNRFEPSFVEIVRHYSEWVPHDIIALADGAAVMHATGDEYRLVGQAVRFRNGVMTVIDATA